MCCTGKDRIRNLTPRQKFQPNQPVVAAPVEPKKIVMKKVKPKKVKLSEVELKEVELEIVPHITRRRKRTKKV